MSSFNLILASNASADIYGNINEANHFYNVLPQQIPATDYEAALTEITYTANIPTIVDEYITVIIPQSPQQIASKDIAILELDLKSIVRLEQIEKNWKNLVFECTMPAPFTNIDKRFDIFSIIMRIRPNILKEHSDFAVIKGSYNSNNNELYFRKVSSIPIYPESEKKIIKGISELNPSYDYKIYQQTWKAEQDFHFKKKYFDTVDSIVDEINSMQGFFKLHLVNEKIVLKENKMKCDIILQNGLEYILGFRDKILREQHTVANYLPQLDRGIFAFFIYCNICSETVVGNSLVRLLRTVHVPRVKYGETINHVIDNPLYIDVSRNILDTIEVEIRDAYGNLIPFQSTKILMTLNFRHKQ